MKLPRLRKPRVMDVIRVDGRLHAVVSIEWPSGRIELEPLDRLLARSLAVGDDEGVTTLQDALEDAGWKRPDSDAPEPSQEQGVRE